MCLLVTFLGRLKTRSVYAIMFIIDLITLYMCLLSVRIVFCVLLILSLLFFHPWLNVFFHIHNCIRIAWLNYPYIPMLNSILSHENHGFLFVSIAHFLFLPAQQIAYARSFWPISWLVDVIFIISCLLCHVFFFFLFLTLCYFRDIRLSLYVFFALVFLVECIQHWISFSKYTRFIRLYGFNFKLYLLSQYFFFI